jgi:hypothetical protein
MSEEVLATTPEFSFELRPTPVPGDLRISWRLSVLLLMLFNSRGKKASLAKLHMLSDAVRSVAARKHLETIISTGSAPPTWRVRVEPAFGRAVDFLIGERFANWIHVGNGAGLELTDKGVQAAKALQKIPDALSGESEFLTHAAKQLFEAVVARVLLRRSS